MSNWERLKTLHQGIGTLCEVYIDHSAGLIKRCYKNDSVTVNGNKTRFSEKEIISFFNNEVYWLKILESKWIPETVEVNHKDRFIVQKYYNEDLLHHRKDILSFIPDIENQVVEMHKFFKKKNVFKRNGSLSNLTWNHEQLIAFDFKWCTMRPEGIEKEIYSYDHYFSKISLNLSQRLKELL